MLELDLLFLVEDLVDPPEAADTPAYDHEDREEQEYVLLELLPKLPWKSLSDQKNGQVDENGRNRVEYQVYLGSFEFERLAFDERLYDEGLEY